MKIGFIGQGYIGKNYADDFEGRGYGVVRYALEEPYSGNGKKIKDCDIVFIAVPTPTTPEGFDGSTVKSVLRLAGEGKIAVIKSTLVPGTTISLQNEFPSIFVLHSPEFFSRSNAADDAAHPGQNIIGIPVDSKEYRKCANRVLSLLPKAPSLIVSSNTSEFFKYVHNTSLFSRSLFMNLLYDTALSLGIEWGDIIKAIKQDPLLALQYPDSSKWHIQPVHEGGRGVGGDCHIKDFETFSRLFREKVGDEKGERIIEAMKVKNIELLRKSGKDLDLLEGVYGKGVLEEKEQ